MELMQPGERFSILLKICLPLLVLILFNVSPASHAVTEDLREAGRAQAGGQPETAGRSETTAGAYRRVLEREPWRTDLWEKIGQAELAGGQAEAAIDALEQADRAGALSTDGRFQLGEAFLRQGESQKALVTWETLLREEGPSARVYERLFQVRRAQRDYPTAIEVLRKWRAFEPQNADVAYLLGINLSVFSAEEALPLLLEASQKDDRYSSAVQVMRRGLAQADVGDDEAYGWLMTGRALGSIGQWDLAEEAFRRSVKASPTFADAWALLGEALYHVNGSGAAELEQANRLDPDSLVVRAVFMMYWLREEKPEVAMVYLEALARQEPDNPIWLVNMGHALAKAQNYEDARKAFQRAVEMEPENSLYWQYLASFSAAYKIDPRALGLPAARQAVLLAPNDAGALDVMGVVLLTLGDKASAERFLQRALEKDATYGPANLHMGWLYLEQDAGRAYLYLKQAAKLGGENEIGDNARQLLNQYFGEGS